MHFLSENKHRYQTSAGPMCTEMSVQWASANVWEFGVARLIVCLCCCRRYRDHCKTPETMTPLCCCLCDSLRSFLNGHPHMAFKLTKRTRYWRLSAGGGGPRCLCHLADALALPQTACAVTASSMLQSLLLQIEETRHKSPRKRSRATRSCTRRKNRLERKK